MKTNMTPPQELALKCAHADLQGALEAHEHQAYNAHDWEAHALSIKELEDAFPEILKPQTP